MLKIDVLALGMLTCLGKGFDLLERHYGQTGTWLSTLPPEEACVYAMISRADTIGVFQIESRAQMSMLPRLKPKSFLRSRHRGGDRPPRPDPGRHGASLPAPAPESRADVSYPSPELKAVLEKTLGVPLFQEQAMKIAIVAAGFTPNEADQLRRAMATFKRVGTIGTFRDKMVERHGGSSGYDRASSPNIASSRSRGSAPMASPRATPPPSRCSSMPRPG